IITERLTILLIYKAASRTPISLYWIIKVPFGVPHFCICDLHECMCTSISNNNQKQHCSQSYYAALYAYESQLMTHMGKFFCTGNACWEFAIGFKSETKSFH